MIKNLSNTESKEFYEFIHLVLSDDEQDEREVNETINFGILDRYPEQLNEEDSSRLLSNKHLDSKYRPKFIDFFSELLAFDNIYINCTNLFNRKYNLKHLKERLTTAEYKNLLILKNLIRTRFILTDDLNVIRLLSSLSLKEIIFFDFYLPKEKTILLGNFDLSLPVYSKCSKSLENIKKIAEDNGLYIRDIEYKN